MTDLNYQLKRSLKAKQLRITVYLDGKVVVTVPMRASSLKAEEFISARTEWVLSKLDDFRKSDKSRLLINSVGKYNELRGKAYELALERIHYFNKTYCYSFNRITIRNQKTRWGSCSKKRNLNFNYKIALLPAELSDYIIVHELCHLKEFNHSRKFWELVAITIPNYLDLRKNINNHRLR